MPLTVGTKLGPYEVLSPLGAGGMGEVYKARDTRLDRDVAVKVLPASFAADADRLSRFEAEAKTTGQLNHPNVVSVYDVGTHDGAPYLVTELLEGETLRERLAQSALPLRKALEFGVQIARGLAAAHGRGIVHRDLKPDNLFITRDGRMKILDFGLARMQPLAAGAGETATAIQATNPGTVLGTVGYMSPEQVRGKVADARSDLFAFGAILFEMLAGSRAFARDSAADSMAAILKEDPPELTASGVAVPPAVDRIIRRCLEKDPEERFQSARDLGFALEAVGGGSATSAVSGAVPAISEPVRVERRIPIVAIAAVGALMLVAGAAAGRFLFAPSATPSISALVQLRQLTFSGADSASQPALAPDAQSFAYVSSAAGNPDIWLQRVGGANPVNLTKDSTAADTMPAFSPDGKSIAFRSDRAGGGLFVMGATGESVRRVTDEGFNPAWSPDGTELAYCTERLTDPSGRQSISQIIRVVVATGAKTKVFDGDGVQPQYSPDGHRLVFWGLPKGTGRRVLYTMPVTGGDPTTLLDDNAINWSPVWSHDGRHVYFASDRQRPMSLWRIAIDQASGARQGDPERVTTATEMQAGLSPEGSSAFAFPVVSQRWTVQRYPFDLAAGRVGATPEVILRTVRNIWQAVPSPDGKMLALKVNDVAEDLEVMNVDGTGVTRLTNDEFRDRSPEWFADSDRILFYSNRTGAYHLWSIRKDGSGLSEMTKNIESLADSSISPDERTIFGIATGFNAAKRGQGFIDLTRPPDARTFEPMPQELGLQGSVGWLPGTRSVVSTSVVKGQSKIVICAYETKTCRPLADGSAAGLIDGKTVLSISANGRVALVDVATGAVRQGQPLPPGITEDGGPAILSNDGKWIYSVRQDQLSNIWLLTVPH